MTSAFPARLDLPSTLSDHRNELPDDGDIADLLSDWIPDAKLREQVLVRNPAKLYGLT